jgi:mono/diheme cytochrome c family protein
MSGRPHQSYSLAGVAILVLTGALAALWLSSQQGPGDAEQWALVEQYCVDCHNSTDYSGDLSFESLTAADIPQHADSFEAAIRKLRGDLMPPPGNPRPAPGEADRLIAWLESTLDDAGELPQAAHVPIQRMSRTEYAAAVSDLLAVEIDPTEYLPTEIEVDGFTNMAAALSVSPAFLEQYVSVARAVARLAVGQPEPKLASAHFPPPRTTDTQDGHTDGLPLGTRGGTRFVHNFPADGEYRFTIADLELTNYARALETEQTMVILIDREEVFRVRFGGMDDLMIVNRGGAPGEAEIMARFADIPVQVTAGDHEVVVTFIERAQAATDGHIYGFVQYGGFSFNNTMRVPRLAGGIEVVGPFNATGVSRTSSREKLFICTPEVASRERECAERIAADLAERAFRRPVDATDIDELMPFFEGGRTVGGSFDAGVEQLVAAVLVSPDFLYRSIKPPADTQAPHEYRLSDLELASRLSFFLWGTLPDDELLDLAIAGRLSEPGAVDAQARRMLNDPRAESLVKVFAFRWLNVDDLSAVEPDAAIFPDFTEELRETFAAEIELFLESILLEERDVRELLTAGHTFVNDRLAEHYGIDGIYGPQFRRIELDDPARHGLLGKAAVLLRTSYGDRTSPVLRGAWVLEKLKGTPPSPPPPGVETDLTTPEGEQPKTIRARLELHREAPNCNACHGVIDPYGIALENFTVLGEWRDDDRAAAAPIDATTMLPNGKAIEGPVELREALLARPDQFVHAFTEKLMMYALGRELEYHDMRQVRGIVRAAEPKNYTLSAIVSGIVASDAFGMQAMPEEE